MRTVGTFGILKMMISLFIVAFLGSSLFLVTAIVVHFLKRDLKFSRNALSKYALGEHGWLLTLGLYSIGTAQVTLSLGLADIYNFSIGNALLTAAGIGAIAVGLFKMEFPIKTAYGYLHRFGAGMQFIFFPISLLLLNKLFVDSELYTFTFIICYANFLILIYMFYTFISGTTHTHPYFGAIQKTNIFLMTVWVISISFVFEYQF